MKTKNVIISVLLHPILAVNLGNDFYFNFLSNVSSMQAQITREKQLLAKDQIKMFTFGLKGCAPY